MVFYQQKMKSLIETLRAAQKAYDEGKPTMSDEEWDKIYFKLEEMEKQWNFVYPDSPTQKIDYQLVTELKKVNHNHPMLSLPKTKNLDDIDSFFDSEHSWIAMPKLDGLTCSLRYVDGVLVSAETRGNGEIGEDILHNAKVISNIPQKIPTKEEVIVDGEVICTYNNFEQFKVDYKNPRNFAAGSVRLLDARECERRKLSFVVWEVIKGYEVFGSLGEKLQAAETDGFTIVPFMSGTVFSKEDVIKSLKQKAANMSYPIDGIVFKYDNIVYGASLGRTAHHFNNAIAYKFYDETVYTILRDVEWQLGRSGILTPIAIFDPVELNGTTCSRASLHNVGIMEKLQISHRGQGIMVCKSNEIIPQVVGVLPTNNFYFESYSIKRTEAENFIDNNLIKIPETCSCCGEPLEQTSTGILQCNNPNCDGKFINKLVHFVGKKGLDIKGLSKETLSKFIDWGYITDLESIFFLQKYEKEIASKAGFGINSVKKILKAIEEARHCKLENFISALGIPGIGYNITKTLCEEIPSYEEFRAISDFSSYEGIGPIKAEAIKNFDYTEADKIYEHLNIDSKKSSSIEKKFEGLTFVVTGKLASMTREQFKKFIEDRGGKVTSTVSKKTSYLINNDSTSTSTKNTEAARLGIPILTEEEFFKKFEL